jgi:spermidine synthase
MCKYFATDDANLGQQVGYLYSINTLGAAADYLFVGYFLAGVFLCFGSSIGSGRN